MGKPFTFLTGDDDFFVREAGGRWFAENAADVEDEYSREVIDGRAQVIDEVVSAVGNFCASVDTVSMFGGVKVVWFRDVSFLADSVVGRSSTTEEALERMKECLGRVDPNTVRVLLTAYPVDKRRSFFKWATKHGEARHLDLGKDASRALLALVRERCQAGKVRIDTGAAEVLIDKVGGSPQMLVSELDKLVTYLAGTDEALTQELVVELVPAFGEGDFFEATEVFFTFRLRPTLVALERHFFNTKEARPLLASLQGRNRLLIQIKVLADAGAIRVGGRGIDAGALKRAAGEYAEFFGGSTAKSNFNVFTQHPFYLSKLADAVRKVPLKRLLDIQVGLVDAFEGLVERPNDQHGVLKEFVTRALS